VERPAKVLCIGADALDKDLVIAMSEAGRLPTFRRLLEAGAWTFTRNPPGLFVGALWPSFATGLSPSRHGRYCYRQLAPGTYEMRRFLSSDIRGVPFWTTLSEQGRRVAVIDVPKTTVSRDLNGIQVADWGTHDPDPGCGLETWPPALAETVTARFGSDPVGACDRWGRDAEASRELRDALVSRVERRAELSAHFLALGGWDLFLTVFTEPQCVGHQFWHLHDPTHPRYDPELARAVGDPMEAVYIAIDAAIGRLVRQAGPDATVLVLASHGMGPHYGANFLLDEVLRRLDLARLPAGGARRRLGALVRWGRARIPARLLPASMRNGVRRGVEKAVPAFTDLAARTCFQVPNNDVYGAIRVNLAGREPNGSVRPGPEYDALCDELGQDLRALVDPATGRPVVRNVIRCAEAYPGEAADGLPDLFVEWDGSVPIAAVDSPKTGRVQGAYGGPRTGDHKPEGLLVALGPGVVPGPLAGRVAVMDVAPTIAHLLGVQLAAVDGRPIAAFGAGA
jgi:predicted AlkP superfamily phosphohydrolase/phosphomutase